jgi:hypothetical protein
VKPKPRTFGVVVHHGPELRPFFQSNVLSELGRKHRVVVFIKNNEVCANVPLNGAFTPEIYDRKHVQPAAYFILGRCFSLFESCFAKVRKARQRRLQLGNYHFTTGVNCTRHRFDNWIGHDALYQLCCLIYKRLGRYFYQATPFRQALEKHNITDLIYYGSTMPEMKCILHTAENAGIALWHYVGNWKDIYIDDFIPVVPKAIFVWSDMIKRDLMRLNPRIPAKNVHVSGNWWFFSFIDYRPRHEIGYYEKKYAFSQGRPIFLWPLSMKVVFPNEHILVSRVNALIEGMTCAHKPLLLLRDNPFGDAQQRAAFYDALSNVRVCSNYWQVSKANNFTYQLTEGEIEWLDLLYHSAGVISTPSTVTLESILMKRRCLNVLFDESGNYSERLAAFAKAPFYQELLSRPDVIMLDTLAQLHEQLGTAMPSSPDTGSLPAIINGNEQSSIAQVTDIISAPGS